MYVFAFVLLGENVFVLCFYIHFEYSLSDYFTTPAEEHLQAEQMRVFGSKPSK